MRRPLTFVFMIAAILNLGACTKARKESSVENTPEQAQAIVGLRGAYAAFNRGDIDAAVKPFDPQIEWSEPAEFPGGGACHGRDEVKRYLAQSRAPWAEGSSEPEQFIPSGNRIVVFVHARFRTKGSNEWKDVRLADVYTIRDGKIVEMQAFANRQDALRWAGVDEQQSR
jgi:ketosteroid isomerase-like protein